MNPNNELVSVIVLARNSASTIREAIDSLVQQTYPHFEILVVDGGSTDSTRELAMSFADPRIRIVAQQGKGLGDARNLGIREARGNYVAYLDSDDVALPRRIEDQLRFLQQHSDHAIVGSWLRLIDGAGAEIGIRRYVQYDHEIRAAMASLNVLPNPGIMFRKEVIVGTGLYTDALPEDYDLWLRLMNSSRADAKMHNLPQVLTQYRVHLGGSKSQTAKEQLLWSLQLRYKYWRQGSLHLSPRALMYNLAQLCLLALPASWLVSAFRWSVKRGQV
jgi:glycosyltransferase involved in cell wall biosynthesis